MSVAVVAPTVPLGSSMDVPELVVGTEELDLNTSTGEVTLLGETHTIVSTEFVKTTIEVVSEVAVSQEVSSSSPTSKKDDRKWREVESVASPPIDIVEDKDSYHVYAEIAGMNLKDITIDLSNNLFTLEGYKQEHHTPNKRKRGASDVLVRQEISKGRFKRVLELPDDVDTEDVNVSFEEGMLQFKIRKVEVDREDSADEESDSDQVSDTKQNNNKGEQTQAQVVDVKAVVVEEVEGEEKSENGKEAGDVEEVNLNNGEIRVALKKNNKTDKKKKHQRPDTTKKLNKKRSSCSVQ